MNICLINASPKGLKSASGYFLDSLQSFFGNCLHCNSMVINNPKLVEEVLKSQAIVIAFPLYVDAIPAHLVAKLEEIQHARQAQPEKTISVYAIVNCGFFDASQNVYALEMMKIFCKKSGLHWNGGLAVGGGGFLGNNPKIPLHSMVKKELYFGLQALAEKIEKNSSLNENCFIEPGFSRFIYQIAGNIGFLWEGRKNGLTKKTMCTRFPRL